MKLNKNDELVIAALKEHKELTLTEIAEKTSQPTKKIFKSLRKLFENELIDSKAHKYHLLDQKTTKPKAKEPPKDESE